jgi:hypothetical protein
MHCAGDPSHLIARSPTLRDEAVDFLRLRSSAAAGNVFDDIIRPF